MQTIMESSSDDAKETADLDKNSPDRRTTTPPTTSNPSRSSSPSCQTLLVIDDNSNSDDSPMNNTNNIPIKPTPPAIAQIPLLQVPTSTLSPSTYDTTNDTVEQQRRRNSSIAKLLGGHPLNNQQYEDIHQQILVDQSVQNATNNNDNGSDLGIQRSRSSITRTLLMHAERKNSTPKLSTNTQSASLPAFSKDFEYLIRRELDKSEGDHPPTRLQRNNSAPKIFQNLSFPSNPNTSLSIQSKLKRKRPLSKVPTTTPNKPPTNVPPFALHDPFELDSSGTTSIPTLHHSYPQSDYLRFDSYKRSRYSNPEQNHQPMNTSSTNPSAYSYPKTSTNSSLYNQFSIHQDRAHFKDGSVAGNRSHYLHSTKLTLPLPIHSLPSTATITHDDKTPKMTLTSKSKVNIARNLLQIKSTTVRSETQEAPRQRSYSNLSNHSDSSPSASSETNGPLKKRLLQAYNSEQHPTSSL